MSRTNALSASQRTDATIIRTNSTQTFMKPCFRLGRAPTLSFLVASAILYGAVDPAHAQSGPPALVTDVQSTYTVIAGEPVTLTANFTGSVPMTNQWTYNG